MKAFTSLALTFSTLLASVSAHGYIVSPPRRAPGAEMSAVCGQTIYNNQASDNAGPIQLLLQSASSIIDINSCNLWLCKGYQFADNTAQVQTYSLGQTIDMEVKIVAPHSGYANVSIVDTKTNAVKGSFLKSWDVYASTATGVTADETSFSITIPTDLTGCATAGECVIQWFWYAPPGVDQTYEGCVDFIIGDGTAASTSATAVTSTTVAATSTAIVPTTTAVAPATSVVETPTTSSIIEIPTTSTVEVPTTTVIEATTTAIEVPTTTAASIKSTSTTTKTLIKSTTSFTKPTTTRAITPTTLITKTRTYTSSAHTTTSAASGTCSTTSVDYNKCLDAANMCIRNAQSQSGGSVDFSACDAQRAACRMC